MHRTYYAPGNIGIGAYSVNVAKFLNFQTDFIQTLHLLFRIISMWSSCVIFFYNYGKCSKLWNTFLILFSNKMLVTRTGIYKMLVRVANSSDPDQTASTEAV